MKSTKNVPSSEKHAFSRPSCLSCKRLQGLDGPDTDEGGSDPICVMLNATPSSALVSGWEQCAGYEPRAASDFECPDSSIEPLDLFNPAKPKQVRTKQVIEVEVTVEPDDELLAIANPKNLATRPSVDLSGIGVAGIAVDLDGGITVEVSP